jgi:disease resistance protein RPM1
MMLEIIISKSAEDNFITVVGGGQKSLLNGRGIIRRLSVQYIDQELAFALANEDLSHVRSLTVTASDCIKHLPSLAEFEALRVLDFEDCKGLKQYDMNSVEKLFQLKYLGLKETDISRLPSGIVMLSDLETLDFRYTSMHELPAGFVQLTKLQHLLAGETTESEVIAARAAIQKEVDAHTNHPRILINAGWPGNEQSKEDGVTEGNENGHPHQLQKGTIHIQLKSVTF